MVWQIIDDDENVLGEIHSMQITESNNVERIQVLGTNSNIAMNPTKFGKITNLVISPEIIDNIFGTYCHIWDFKGYGVKTLRYYNCYMTYIVHNYLQFIDGQSDCNFDIEFTFETINSITPLTPDEKIIKDIIE
jgi:hypothetical protein